MILAVLSGAAAQPLISEQGAAHQARVGSHDQTDCDVGGTPTRPYVEQPPEHALRYQTRPVVIGCPTLASGRRFELVGYQLGTAEHSRLCIDHYDLEREVSWGCGSNRVANGGAIGSTSTARLRPKPPVVSGTVSRRVRWAVVRWEIRRRIRRARPTTVIVRGRELLRAIAVRRPFGRFLAEVPRRARAVTAEAFDRRRHSLGLVFFPGFRRPVGEGRTCYGRPRIAAMRLLDPPRAGERSRLRVVVTYSGGYISSLAGAVAGTVTDRVRLPRPPDVTSRSRRVVTLRVGFRRRGTVGIDAIALGRPFSRSCGATVASEGTGSKGPVDGRATRARASPPLTAAASTQAREGEGAQGQLMPIAGRNARFTRNARAPGNTGVSRRFSPSTLHAGRRTTRHRRADLARLHVCEACPRR